MSSPGERVVKCWVTTPDRKSLLAPQPERAFVSAAIPAADGAEIRVNDARTYQSIDGFGAALTDSSAWLLMRTMSEAAREALLRDLFDPNTGNGFSVLRLPMGASDFAVHGSYTYDDVPAGESDPELRRFSIAHDREYILPLLRRIRQINPSLKVIASPWSAPAWMKTNRKLNGGWLDRPAYPAFARYFVRFVQAYEAEGIPVEMVTVQNEPRHETDTYPSMRMEPRDQARFVRDHLGPAFAQAGIRTKILIWDHNWDAPDYPLDILADAGARHFISGTAFHGYGGDVSAQSKVRDAYPDKEIHFTESSGGEFAPDFGANLRWDVTNLIVGATRNWAKTVLKWNLVLDENHGPTNGGCKDCRGIVTLNRKTGEVTRNEEFYAFGHASHFVRPGARRIESSATADLPNVAFRNPDGTLALVACNPKPIPASFALRWRDEAAHASLLPGTVMTFTW